MPLNIANGQFDVQVQFAATDLYGDLLGYFQRPKNYGGTHVIRWGSYATDSGVQQHRQRRLQHRRRGCQHMVGPGTT